MEIMKKVNVTVEKIDNSFHNVQNNTGKKKLKSGKYHTKGDEIEKDKSQMELNEELVDLNMPTLEKYFKLDNMEEILIQPDAVHFENMENEKEFKVTNHLSFSIVIIWNKDRTNNFIIEPFFKAIDKNSSEQFNVVFRPKEQDRFYRSILDATIYSGEGININDILLKKSYKTQEKVYAQRILPEYFLTYSGHIHLTGNSFKNNANWIPKYTMQPNQFQFLYLINNQQSVAFVSACVQNTGHLPLCYQITEEKNKYFELTVNPKLTYIKSNDYQIIYAYIKIKSTIPKYLKQKLYMCLNSNEIYRERKYFEIYTDSQLELRIPKFFMSDGNVVVQSSRRDALEDDLKEIDDNAEIIEDQSRESKPKNDEESVHEDDLVWQDIDLMSEMQLKEYHIVKFPTVHSNCSVGINIPLHNSSLHSVKYELEIYEQESKLEEFNKSTSSVFEIGRTHGTLFSNQFEEVKCTFKPKQNQKYNAILKCKVKSFLQDVIVPDLWIILKGNSKESEVLCKPDFMNLGKIQKQCLVKRSFSLENLQTSKLNFILRCKLSIKDEKILGSLRGNATDDKICKFESRDYNFKEFPEEECLTNHYEHLKSNVKKLNVIKRYCERDKTGKTFDQCNKGIDTNMNKGFIDIINKSESICSDLSSNFAIINPNIEVLRENCTKCIDFTYHPFTKGDHELEIYLYPLENCLDDSLISYDDNVGVKLLNINATCVEALIEVADIKIDKTNTWFSKLNYYCSFLNIAKLNKALMKFNRIVHEFTMPAMESGKEITIEIEFKNVNSVKNVYMININKGLCNCCHKLKHLKHKKFKCKHYNSCVTITPSHLNFNDNDTQTMAFQLKYNNENKKIVFRTVLYVYVEDTHHDICHIRNYVELIIKLNGFVMMDGIENFVIPIDAVEDDNKKEHEQSEDLGCGDFYKIQHVYYQQTLAKANYAQAVWLYNSSSYTIPMYIDIDEYFAKYIKIINADFIIRKYSNHPVLILINEETPLEQFSVQIKDSASNIIRNVEISVMRETAEISEGVCHVGELKTSSPHRILFTDTLNISKFPVHSTVKRKLTLTNVYDRDDIVFNWKPVNIIGAFRIQVEPKIGRIKANEMEHFDLIITSLCYPSKLNVSICCEIYKEKYFVTYFTTLEYLRELRRNEGEHCDDNGKRKSLKNIIHVDEYEKNVYPNPKLVILGIDVSTYIQKVEYTDDIFINNKIHDSVHYEMNKPLNEQKSGNGNLSPNMLKTNKQLVQNIKSTLSNCLEYLVHNEISDRFTNPSNLYENFKLKAHKCDEFNDNNKSVLKRNEVIQDAIREMITRNLYDDETNEQSNKAIGNKLKEENPSKYEIERIREILAANPNDDEFEDIREGAFDECVENFDKIEMGGKVQNEYFLEILKGKL